VTDDYEHMTDDELEQFCDVRFERLWAVCGVRPDRGWRQGRDAPGRMPESCLGYSPVGRVS
jgi:hypothetical protein